MRRFLSISSCLLLGLVAGPFVFLAEAANTVSLVSVSGYGNLHAGGVTLTISGDDNQNGSAALE